MWLLLAVWATGATAPPVLGDPGPLVRWGLPVITTLSRASAALSVGALTLCLVVVPATGPGASTWTRLRDLAAYAGAAWALLQGASSS